MPVWDIIRTKHFIINHFENCWRTETPSNIKWQRKVVGGKLILDNLFKAKGKCLDSGKLPAELVP